MSSSDLGSCVVCGKETATRCAGCAKNGIKWMHFCSREHQKLVSSLLFSPFSVIDRLMRAPQRSDLLRTQASLRFKPISLARIQRDRNSTIPRRVRRSNRFPTWSSREYTKWTQTSLCKAPSACRTRRQDRSEGCIASESIYLGSAAM